MTTEIQELVLAGFVAIIIGLVFLVNLLGELDPDKRYQWCLGIALGSGIIAFSLKIIFIVVFDSIPESVINVSSVQNLQTVELNEVNALQSKAGNVVKKKAYTWQALPEVAPSPKDNPSTREKIELGKKLFFDTRLSANNKISCASCHEVSDRKGGADGLVFSIGIYNQRGKRNAPSVLNAAFQSKLFWDGRASSLEQQAKGPLVNPLEMGMPSLDAVVKRLQSVPEYMMGFEKVFSETPAITIDNIVKAIATYERSLITPNSAYDKFVKGDSSALSASQIRGMALFESTGCIYCHSGANFSGASVFRSGGAFRLFPSISNKTYEENYRLTDDLGALNNVVGAKTGIWRIPSLRNVSRTAPYFHNGSVKRLEEAVRIMARVQLNQTLSNADADDSLVSWSTKDRQLSISANRALSDEEIMDIVAFLKGLDGDLSKL